MTKQIIVLHERKPSMIDRRQPLLETATTDSTTARPRHARKESIAEVAGGTTAECAAVCCCCPCGLVNLLVLAVYKLPAGLCRKALRKKRRHRLIKQGLLPNRKCNCDDKDMQIHPVNGPVAMVNAIEEAGGDDNKDVEVVELDKEMWDKFYGTGFWRSDSQRSDETSVNKM